MRRFFFILSAGFLFTLINCKKSGKLYTAHFYAIHMKDEGPFTLQLNGTDRGTLPVLPIQLSCRNDTLKSKTLRTELTAGKYHVEIQDKSGNVVSACSFKFSDNRTSASGGTGGQSIRLQNECLIVEMTD